MPYDYDAIVVGARCAGASTAMLLAGRGHRVLLVDRAHFPSEISQGHFVHRHGPARLARWGILDQIVASGCPPVTALTSYFGDFPLVCGDLELGGIAWGYGPRRSVLDKLLVDAACAAGAELEEGLAVDGLLTSDGRVWGIRTATGKRISARLTIGADGRHSRVAREVHAAEYESVPTLACWYFTYFRDVPEPGFEMHILPRHNAIFAHPTNDALMAVFVGWPIQHFASIRENLELSFMAAIHGAPGLGERLGAGQRAERFYGTGDMQNFLRQAAGPGWALVGDAGCHKDPFLALGICDALRDAELLADAVHAGLTGTRALDQALTDYAKLRDEATLPDYRENLRMAKLLPVADDVLRLRQALRENPADATRFALATHSLIPRQDFFNPANLERILAQSDVADTVAPNAQTEELPAAVRSGCA
jgi:flavin-dependent dehydrogenase